MKKKDLLSELTDCRSIFMILIIRMLLAEYVQVYAGK